MKNQEIQNKLKNKGIQNPLLLEAFRGVPKEFLSYKYTLTGSYQKIDLENTWDAIEPRLIMLLRMLEKIIVKKENRILAIGIDSVYMLFVLSKIYKEVYVVEANLEYSTWVLEILNNNAVSNVFFNNCEEVKEWEVNAPYDAIIIASEFPKIPELIKKQLQIGGKLIASIGPDWLHITLEIIERVSEFEYRTRRLRENYFIPKPLVLPKIGTKHYPETEILAAIKEKIITFNTIDEYPLDDLLDRIGDTKVVLIGEASHGTSEFYLGRQKITKALIEKKGFNFVCAEADWSDAEQINAYVRNLNSKRNWMPFDRFPQWMWKNKEVLDFIEWLKEYNTKNNNDYGFYGLDLYGLANSIDLVIKYLNNIDSDLSNLAKERYACIIPYLSDPAVYGKMVLSRQLESCEKDILNMLIDLLKNKHKLHHSPEYFYACQNANVVINAERYYKAMYYGSAESWNLRDFHMFYSLKSLLSYFGEDSKAIVWAHNSHIGNALATEMYSRGEINIGHLCKEYFGNKSYHIGFGTHYGNVAAAHNWGDKMQIMKVNTSISGSYESLCNQIQFPAFSLPLKDKDSGKKLRVLLSTPRLERAIGVIYRPQTERISHYFHAVLPSQFDEYIWFNKTQAVTPISYTKIDEKELNNFHPFSLIDE
jgi:protein-L-isoaspartate(D-aspartate) O-methyltransferase